MFTNDSWLLVSNKLQEEWDNLTDEIKQYQAEAIIQGYELGFEKWKLEQRKNVRLFSNGLAKIFDKHKDNFKIEIEEMYKAVNNVANKELNSAIKLDSYFIENKVKSNEEETELLFSKVMAYNYNSPNIVYRELMSDKNRILYEGIEKYTKKLDNAYSVNYANGRKVSYRAYTDMRIRTDINNYASDMLQKSGEQLGIAFYLCNALIDCADDHADYQGKVYLADNWRAILKNNHDAIKFAEDNNLMTLSQVKDAPIYLTTRPNCRHYFIPITFEQAQDSKNTLKNLRMTRGKYKEENYQLLKKQRYLEREIRKTQTNKKITTSQLQYLKGDDIIKAKKNLNAYDKKLGSLNNEIEMLVDKHYFLKRQPRREDVEKLSYDLGVEFASLTSSDAVSIE